MKLFLTSAGLVPEITPDFVKLLGRETSDARLVFIPTAADPEPDKDFVNKDKIRLAELDFRIYPIDLKGQSYDSLTHIFKNADMVFVEGGNTFYLLDWVNKCGFAQALREFLERGGVYTGVSAGSRGLLPN